MRRGPMQAHPLDQCDIYHQHQSQTLRQPSTIQPTPHQRILAPTLSATVDRRTTLNNKHSNNLYPQRSFDNTAYSRRNFDTTDAIEPFPNHRNTLTLSNQMPSVCNSERVTNLNETLQTELLNNPVDFRIPSAAQLDATVTCLWVLTPLAATVSAVIVLVAVMTNQWLHTEEKMANPSYNGTGDRDYLYKLTVSGLWRLCSTLPGEKNFECNEIDYFSKEEYAPDPNDSTMAIPYAVTKSSVFLLLATFVLLSGYLCCAVGHCARHRRIFTFTAGVLFIVSGLLMLIGLVMYISVFKAEVGSKLRQPSFTQPPVFTYRYGYSFILYVSGFMTIELAGTSAVFLFIYWYQKDWLVKYTERNKSKYSNNDSNISYTNLEQGSIYPCRRHPQAYTLQRTQPIGAACEPSTSNTFTSPSKQRRYFFDKESRSGVSPSCSLHRKKDVYVSTSLRDISVQQGYEFPPPPPPITTFGDQYNGEYQESNQQTNIITYQNGDSYLGGIGSTRSLHIVGANTLPRDATTNTISTTVDVMNPCDDFGYGDAAPGNFSVPHEHEFVTFDLDRPLELRSSVSGGITSTGRKDFTATATDTLRRTTPV